MTSDAKPSDFEQRFRDAGTDPRELEKMREGLQSAARMSDGFMGTSHAIVENIEKIREAANAAIAGLGKGVEGAAPVPPGLPIEEMKQAAERVEHRLHQSASRQYTAADIPEEHLDRPVTVGLLLRVLRSRAPAEALCEEFADAKKMREELRVELALMTASELEAVRRTITEMRKRAQHGG